MYWNRGYTEKEIDVEKKKKLPVDSNLNTKWTNLFFLDYTSIK